MGQVLTLEAVRAWRADQARAGRSVVFTNGVFDLLHVGHVRYLQAARALGDALVVGLNSDAATAALKPGRPLVPQAERGEVLAALACVNVVVVFDGTDANDLVGALRPDVYVKGGDWGQAGGKQPPEAALVAAYGGRIAYLPYVAGHSTSALIERIAAGGAAGAHGARAHSRQARR
jgi:D-glycero-beta-D-manno-heptose 1-phosphate adenylyltransferase